MWQTFWNLIDRGGFMMWPLLGLSLLSVTLLVERAWFWVRTNQRARLTRVGQMQKLLRRGDRAGARLLAEGDDSVYGRVVLRLLEEPVTEARAVEVLESERGVLERFMPWLSTTITAAPLLGLLGTVLGLIRTFHILAPAEQLAAAGARTATVGLGEALINTAAGLIIAIVVLFPFSFFRAQVERTLGRIESLIVAAGAGGAQA